jgi:hypothetical protein
MAKQDRQPLHVSADNARGGEIELRTPAQRWIFLAGLIGVAILACILVARGLMG